MRIFIGGSRIWTDREKAYAAFDKILSYGNDLLVGDAPGIDEMAISYAYDVGIPMKIFAVGGSTSDLFYPSKNIFRKLAELSQKEDFVSGPNEILWWAGGQYSRADRSGKYLNLKARLARRTEAAIANANRAYHFFENPDSRGTTNALKRGLQLGIESYMYMNHHHEPKEVDLQSKRPYVFMALPDDGWFKVTIWEQKTLF